MAHADLAYKTLTGQQIRHTKSFNLALDLQDDAGIDLKDARFIVHVAGVLSDYFGCEITYHEMRTWALVDGKPFPYIMQEYLKVKAQVEAHRAQLQREAQRRADLAFIRTLNETVKFFMEACPELAAQIKAAR